MVCFDKIGFYKKALFSQLLYFIIPKMIEKFKSDREALVEKMHLFIRKYIEEIDVKFNRECIISEIAEIEDNYSFTNMIEYFPDLISEMERLSYYFS